MQFGPRSALLNLYEYKYAQNIPKIYPKNIFSKYFDGEKYIKNMMKNILKYDENTLKNYFCCLVLEP